MPASPFENKSAGCNKLIKEGALLTESADDILQTLAVTQNQTLKTFQNATLTPKTLDFEKKEVNIAPKQNDCPEKHNILQLIGSAGLWQDELIRHLKADTADVLVIITELELEGLVIRENGGFLSLTKEGLRKIK